MAAGDIRPNGNARVASWLNVTGTWSEVDDDPTKPASEADYISGSQSTCAAYFDLTAMPADFERMSQVSITLRLRTRDLDTSTISLYAQIGASNEVDTLSSLLTCATLDSSDSNWAVLGPLSFAGVVPGDLAIWNGAQLGILGIWDGADSSYLDIAAIELDIVYVVSQSASPSLSASRSASASGSSSASHSASESESASASLSASSSESSSESSEDTTMVLTVELVFTDSMARVGQEATLTIGGNQQRQRIIVNTSETTVTIDSSMGAVGLCYVYHDSNTNAQYVDIGYSAGVYNHRLLPGECGLIPLGITTSSLFMVADAYTYVEYEITERSISIVGD